MPEGRDEVEAAVDPRIHYMASTQHRKHNVSYHVLYLHGICTLYSGRGKYNARGKYSAAGDFAQNDSFKKKFPNFFSKNLKYTLL